MSNDLIHYVHLILQNPENQFKTAILHMTINDHLKRGFSIDVVTDNIMTTLRC